MSRPSKDNIADALCQSIDDKKKLELICRRRFFQDGSDCIKDNNAFVEKIMANCNHSTYKNNPTTAECLKALYLADEKNMFAISGNEAHGISNRMVKARYLADAAILQQCWCRLARRMLRKASGRFDDAVGASGSPGGKAATSPELADAAEQDDEYTDATSVDGDAQTQDCLCEDGSDSYYSSDAEADGDAPPPHADAPTIPPTAPPPHADAQTVPPTAPPPHADAPTVPPTAPPPHADAQTVPPAAGCEDDDDSYYSSADESEVLLGLAAQAAHPMNNKGADNLPVIGAIEPLPPAVEKALALAKCAPAVNPLRQMKSQNGDDDIEDDEEDGVEEDKVGAKGGKSTCKKQTQKQAAGKKAVGKNAAGKNAAGQKAAGKNAAGKKAACKKAGFKKSINANMLYVRAYMGDAAWRPELVGRARFAIAAGMWALAGHEEKMKFYNLACQAKDAAAAAPAAAATATTPASTKPKLPAVKPRKKPIAGAATPPVAKRQAAHTLYLKAKLADRTCCPTLDSKARFVTILRMWSGAPSTEKAHFAKLAEEHNKQVGPRTYKTTRAHKLAADKLVAAASSGEVADAGEAGCFGCTRCRYAKCGCLGCNPDKKKRRNAPLAVSGDAVAQTAGAAGAATRDIDID